MKKLLALTALVSLASFATAQRNTTLVWSGAITGPTSDAGSSYAAGVEDYCKYANSQKMLSVTLNCVVRDDQYNNANTQRNFEEFVGVRTCRCSWATPRGHAADQGRGAGDQGAHPARQLPHRTD
ncbi:hypothetical protein ACFSC4_05915 [Deinococcus malanensis]|uniref:hypothetical protein n=1 Tax=Deinococcus malanensis TaxID=1706855 RepID=UPI0036414F5B